MPNPLEDALAHAGRALACVGDALGAAADAALGQVMGGRTGGRGRTVASATLATQHAASMGSWKPTRAGPALADLAAVATPPAAGAPASTSPTTSAVPPDLLARLASIPVYAVVNRNSDIVLVTGEDPPPAADPASPPPTRRELGLLFMSESGARSLADQVKRKAPRKVAKEIVVGQTTLDRVYTLAASADARPAGAEGVMFRFVPDPAQVARALATYAAAGRPAPPGFAGVPVFQAGGLSVSSSRARYTPLFLDAADMDEALSGAETARAAAAKGAAEAAAAAEVADAETKLAALPPNKDGRKRAAAEARLAAARARAVDPLAGAPPPPPPPHVEVGSLESVLAAMASTKGGKGGGGGASSEWATAMLVPSGSVTARVVAAAAAAAGGKKGAKK